MSFITSQDRRIHYCKQGDGPITIIFESGITGGIEDWSQIQPVLAERYTTISYARAGNGKSDAYSEAYTLDQMFKDFERVAALRSEGPLILVGHSFGGSLIRYWSNTLTTAIAGMCYVDPSDYQYTRAMMSYRTKAQQTYWQNLVTPPDLKNSEKITERLFFKTFLKQIDAMPLRADINTQLIACDNLNGDKESIRGFGLDPELAPVSLLLKDNKTWENTHRDWLKQVSEMVFHLAQGARHHINLTRPELVISCIEELADPFN